MGNRLHLGLWQSAGTPGDVEANLAEVERVATDGCRDGVDMLVFPECFLTGYYSESPLAGIARSVSSQVLARLARVSEDTGVALVVGSYEASGDGVHNSAFVFSPAGGHVGTYRKRALFGDWERRVFTAGTRDFAFHFRGFRIGLNICYDIEFPERVRELARDGCDLVVCPTAVMQPFDMVPRHVVPTRAFENHLFVAYANRIGVEGPYRFLGMSRIVDPLGQVAASAETQQILVRATLDLSLRDAARRDYDYLADLDRQGDR